LITLIVYPSYFKKFSEILLRKYEAVKKSQSKLVQIVQAPELNKVLFVESKQILRHSSGVPRSVHGILSQPSRIRICAAIPASSRCSIASGLPVTMQP